MPHPCRGPTGPDECWADGATCDADAGTRTTLEELEAFAACEYSVLAFDILFASGPGGAVRPWLLEVNEQPGYGPYDPVAPHTDAFVDDLLSWMLARLLRATDDGGDGGNQAAAAGGASARRRRDAQERAIAKLVEAGRIISSRSG